MLRTFGEKQAQDILYNFTNLLSALEHLCLFHNAVFSSYLVNIVRIRVEVVSLR